MTMHDRAKSFPQNSRIRKRSGRRSCPDDVRRSGVSGSAVEGGSTVASVRRRGVRGLSQMRAAGARLPARALRELPRREASGVQLQAPRLLPELWRPEP
jgi:hypothetical protein